MATPDDLFEFEASQAGFAAAASSGPQEYARGVGRALHGPDALAEGVGITPSLSSSDWRDEVHLPANFRKWRRLLSATGGG